MISWEAMVFAGATRGFGVALVAVGVAASALGPQPVLADSPARGRLLVATRQVVGPFFAQTVVLLLDHDAQGAVGLVINRPTSHTLSQVVEGVDGIEGRDDPVFMGGPVGIDGSLMLLVRADDAPHGAMPVVDDVHATGSVEVLRALLAAGVPPTRLRAYVGYAGWAPGQLDHEVARGDWHVVPSRSELIFETGASDIWPQLTRENEGLEVQWRTPEPRAADSARVLDGLDLAPRAIEDGADLVHDLRVALGPGHRP
jgi:putative transcriptional regulator